MAVVRGGEGGAGKPAQTTVRLLEGSAQACLVACKLHTGRTHQIRVHMASIGHAVVGDDLYGGVRHSFEVSRPFLHARHLEFLHPRTGETVVFDSPLPADLQGVLDRLS